MTTLFISGIDTDVGKSVACGLLAKALIDAGHKVFTQKWVETGVETASLMKSADLATHEKIVGHKFNTQEPSLHAPYLFKVPASPHLAACLEGVEIAPAHLKLQTQSLQESCEHLLIEGAGGLCVPLNDESLVIDLVGAMCLPVILVTSGKLGSLNHTILSLNYCQQRNIEVRAVIYNFHPESDRRISQDSRLVLRSHAQDIYPNTLWIDMRVGMEKFTLEPEDLAKIVL